MKGNASRMVSLFGIVALGVMMLTGLMSIAPSMRSAAQKYYVQQNVFDLRVLSTLGLSDQDIAAIAATPGVEAVMPVKTLDLEANWQGQEERIVVQLQALQQDPAADTDANMNRLVLRSGRMPQTANECVVHVMGYQAEIAEGTVLTLPEDTEGTKHKEYTVVGLVQDPQHISTDKESSTVGNGQLNYIAYVLDGELTADYYTACYIKAENAGQYDNYSQEYQDTVDQVADRLEQISTAQCVQRREQLMDTANEKLAEARQTYDDQKAEAEQKFAEAEQQLDDAQKQLDDAKAQLDAGEAELAQQKKNLPDTMQNGADQLVDGEEQVLEFEEQLQQIQLLVNNPTYYGICSDLRAIVKMAHDAGMLCLADEAHGTHFYFGGGSLPVSAMAAGADMASVSMHKSGGSLTQSSLLLIGPNVHPGYVRQIINLTQTTSGSYLLMSSLDISRRNLALRGRQVFHQVADMAEYAREEINAVGGYYAFGKELCNGNSVFDFDTTKLSVHTLDIGLAGIEVYDILRDEYDIQIEFGDIGNILAYLSIGDRPQEIERLVSALAEIKRRYHTDGTGLLSQEYIDPVVAASPQEAFYAPKKSLPLRETEGMVCSEFVMCYPPGIPILAPGERITKEILNYIEYAKAKGCSMTGPEDPDILHLNVLA